MNDIFARETSNAVILAFVESGISITHIVRQTGHSRAVRYIICSERHEDRTVPHSCVVAEWATRRRRNEEPN